jgi:hypothetical protein
MLRTARAENVPMTESTPAAAPRRWLRPVAWIALLLAPVNLGVWLLAVGNGRDRWLFLTLLGLFVLLALAQFAFGIAALVTGLRARGPERTTAIGTAFVGGLAATAAVVGGAGGALIGALMAGGGWGRPLRLRGRQVHPDLRLGSDWADGARPDPAGLDRSTRLALEALWLHDAQKEHASVPAFARVSWLLAAVGAPADLLAWCQRAALEEIEHAQRCFALAAGYGESTHTVEPMPELLHGGLDVQGSALELLARESLADGCQLEDFNADVAAACAEICEEPTTRAVLLQIAREERSHAEFSWAVLAWALGSGKAALRPVVERALAQLADYPRPTAVSEQAMALVARADAAGLRRHGRLPDARCGELWQQRLEQTRRRAQALCCGGSGAGTTGHGTRARAVTT